MTDTVQIAVVECSESSSTASTPMILLPVSAAVHATVKTESAEVMNMVPAARAIDQW